MARWIILEPETAPVWLLTGCILVCRAMNQRCWKREKREIKYFKSRLIRIFVYWLNIGTILHGCCHTKVQTMRPVQVFSLSLLHSYLYPCAWTLSYFFATLFEFTEVQQEVHATLNLNANQFN